MKNDFYVLSAQIQIDALFSPKYLEFIVTDLVQNTQILVSVDAVTL